MGYKIAMDRMQDFGRCVETFIYETPLYVIASLVGAVAALRFAPCLSMPLFAFSGAVILSRITLRVLEICNKKLYVKMNEKMDYISRNYRYVYLSALTICIVASIIFPLASIVAGGATGVYKGMTVEIEISEWQCEVQEEGKLEHVPTSFMDSF